MSWPDVALNTPRNQHVAGLSGLARLGYAIVALPASSHEHLLGALEIASGLKLRVQTREIVDSLAARSAFRFSMTAAYGRGEFPLHTDRAHDRIPPRFLLLSQAETLPGVLTRVVPLADLTLSESDRSTLSREVWTVRYGRRPFLSPILNDTLVVDDLVFRWDPICMTSEQKRESSEILYARLRTVATRDYQLTSTHTLIIDNWHCLHGRTAIPDAINRRSLRRTLVEVVT